MKICKNCGRVYDDSVANCEICGKSVSAAEDKNTPVYLVSASGFEVERIRAALSESGIPSDAKLNETRTKPEIMYGHKGSCDLYVPLAAYEEAYDILVGIGVAEPREETEYVSAVELDEDNKDENYDTPEIEDEMSPKKRAAVKIVSAIIFIIVASLVIFGTDYITGFIKGLFS